MVVGLRPYYTENTGSHPNPEDKLYQAELVLGWGTTLEPSVLQAFTSAFVRSLRKPMRLCIALVSLARGLVRGFARGLGLCKGP